MNLLSILVLALWCAVASAAPEVVVSNREIKDVEFDSGRHGIFCASCNGGAGNARFVQANFKGEMWIGQIDPTTGDFIHRNGRGVLVDTNVCGPGSVGNGPEWIVSDRGSELVYTRWADGTTNEAQNRSLGFARVENGAWVAGAVAGTQLRQNPGGSLDPDDPTPLAVYTNTTRDTLYWRQFDASSGSTIEHVVPLSYRPGTTITRRFVAGTRSMLLTAPAPRDGAGRTYRQVFLFHTDTNALEQLTFDPSDKNGGFMWRAPEFGDRWVFFTVVNATELRIYLRLADDSGWEVLKSVSSGDGMPYIGSPEYFTHNGKSRIYFWLSNHPSSSTAPSKIAMTGIDPALPSLTMLATDVDAVAHSRRDPEHYITARGPYIYYLRMQLGSGSIPFAYEGIHRVDTGLGPRLP